jgi:cobalt transporter subunit CbtB
MNKAITINEFRIPLPTLAVLAVLFAFTMFAIGYDQGQILSIVFGDDAYNVNYLHELFHDTRHSLGFPCH